MKLTKLLIVFFFLSLKAFSQQVVLTSSGEKVSLNYLSSSGGTISGTLSTKAGINNTGTITNTGTLINTGNLTVNGNGTITGTITAGAVTYPNTAGTNGQVLTTDGSGTASWAAASVGGVSSIGTISSTSTVNGASISSGVLNLAPADGTNGGIVSINAQTFAGKKTFSDSLVAKGIRATDSLITMGFRADSISTRAFTSTGTVKVDSISTRGFSTNYNITVNGLTIGRGTGTNTYNTALGNSALSSNAGSNGGVKNTAVGYFAMKALSGPASNNTATGYYSLSGILTAISGQGNTANGSYSLGSNTSGNYNTGIGDSALLINTTGSYNTALGHWADVTSNNFQNATAIGYLAKVKASNTIQLGNSSIDSVVTAGKLKLGTITYPNTHNSTAGQVLTITASGTASFQAVDTHTIGESFGGGKVFYVYDGGKHGLIAALSDANGGAGIRWNAGEYQVTQARADGVGAGYKNNSIIIANQGVGDGNDYAATVTNQYSVTQDGVTYGDWYLPSKHELGLLMLQKNIVGGFNGDWYWSSTQTNGITVDATYTTFDRAWLISKNGITWYPNVTNEPWFVRAIRAF